MKTATLDFEATRAELRAALTKAETELAAVRDRLGELALDCQLGNRPESDLETARGGQATLTARVGELQAALEAVDARESEHVAAEAEKQRESDMKRLASLQHALAALGVKVIDLATQLGAVLAEGHAAVQEADALGRKLGVNTVAIAQWPVTARQVIAARLGEPSSFLRPGEQEAAERAIAGQVTDP
jgi:chromosome segregation ATPase